MTIAGRQYIGLIIAWLLVLVLPVCAQPHPKLIVVIAVDQMRADYLDRFAPYEDGGLRRLATKGARFLNANYSHIPTETCPGHSILLSGRNPAHTGIVANDWYDRKKRRLTYCLDDPDSPLLGEPGPGVSPKNFLGDNLGDWLQSSYPGARVYSISLKDRGAILLGGRRPQGAFWFSHQTGHFISSRYYGNEIPKWIEDFNRKHLLDSYAGKEWTTVLPPSSRAYHTEESVGHFPHPMPQKADRSLYDAVYSSPFGDEVLEQLAEWIVSTNHLGENAHNAPDLLAISFSSNDAVGHAFGPDSPEIADEQIRLDRSLGHLIGVLSGRLGFDSILWVLSADHGSEPTPEAEFELRGNKRARRRAFSDAIHSVETQLNTSFGIIGPTHWFAGYTESMLYFDPDALARHHISLASARRTTATQVRDVPGIDGFYDAAHLDSVPGWIGTSLRNSAFPGRSGDVYYLTKEWTLFASEPTGTSHADPWPYDTHVPMLLAGWHVGAQRIGKSVQIVDLAPTVADLIGVHWSPAEVLDGKSRKQLLRTTDPRKDALPK